MLEAGEVFALAGKFLSGNVEGNAWGGGGKMFMRYLQAGRALGEF